eukprot:GILJ01010958.1.p1 GENE.GILJ01010958.1~~GILJ01010958.1.p1  ORF type:complete len:375 (-),score=34.31 GILJ01010958.1:234-1358(-)
MGISLEDGVTKLDAVRSSVAALCSHLRDSDRLCVVAFNGSHEPIYPLTAFGEIDRLTFFGRLQGLQASGTRDVNATFRAVARVFGAASTMESKDDFLVVDGQGETLEYANRVLVFTTAGDSWRPRDLHALRTYMDMYAARSAFVSLVVVGDPDISSITSSIGDVRGTSILHSQTVAGLTRCIDEGFEPLMCPIAFDIKVSFSGANVHKIYTTEQSSESFLLEMSKRLPYRAKGGFVKGDWTVVELQGRHVPGSRINILLQYTGLNGKTYRRHSSIVFSAQCLDEQDVFSHQDIRKSLYLIRSIETAQTVIEIGKSGGLIRGEYDEFLRYMEREIVALKDVSLTQKKQEIELLLDMCRCVTESWELVSGRNLLKE